VKQATNPTASAHTDARASGDVQASDTRPSGASTPGLDADVLANAIQSELRHDSLTAALPIEVEVWDRVVHLRGVVSDSSEADAAESAAARVDGVRLVADDLELRPTRPTETKAP
jgi:osmotically-inducible protein OsmY